MGILELRFLLEEGEITSPRTRLIRDAPGRGFRPLGWVGAGVGWPPESSGLPGSLGKRPRAGCGFPSGAGFGPKPGEKRRLPSSAGPLPLARPGPLRTGVVLRAGKCPHGPLRGGLGLHGLTP